jgi:hypothetical protein
MQCMPAALEQTGTNIVTSRSAFILRFISTIALWTVEFPKLYLDTSFAFLAKRFAWKMSNGHK